MVLDGMGSHPALDLLQGRAANRRADTVPAELHLVAAVLEEHDELRRDLPRELGSQVLFHERQGEVEARRHPGRVRRPRHGKWDPSQVAGPVAQ